MTTPLKSGVWGVLATPFSGSAHDVCEPSLEREVKLFADAGVAGLTVLGVFGEASSLTASEQQDVVDTVCAIKGDLPVVIGVPGRATHTVIEQIDNITAVARDLAGVMVQVNTADPVALHRHLSGVHGAVGVPLVVQDYPLVSGVRINQGDLARVVADLGDAVSGVKSEAPPTPSAIATLTKVVDVPVFGGLGGVGLLDELAAGSAGAMTGFSFPEALVATVRAFATEGLDRAREIYAPWLPLVNFEAQAGISLAVRKELLRARGLFIESDVRAPAASFPDNLSPLVDAHLKAAEAQLRDLIAVP